MTTLEMARAIADAVLATRYSDRLADSAQAVLRVLDEKDHVLCRVQRDAGGSDVGEAQPVRCVVGQYCAEHDYVHGAEAEELRKGVTALIDSGRSAGYLRRDLQKLLDRIDARDSLAFLEAPVMSVPSRWGPHLYDASGQCTLCMMTRTEAEKAGADECVLNEPGEAKQLADRLRAEVRRLTDGLAAARQELADRQNLCETAHVQPLLSREYPPLDPPEMRGEDGTDNGLDHRLAMEWLVKRSLEADDYDHSFALYWRATTALREAWHAAHPDRPQDVWPGTAPTCAWAAEVVALSERRRDALHYWLKRVPLGRLREDERGEFEAAQRLAEKA